MTHHFFLGQMERIKKFFGAENYPLEKMRLIWIEVRDLQDGNFLAIVNFFIAEREPKWPPHVSHFREQAAVQRQEEFKRRVAAAGGTVKEKKPWPTNGKEAALEQLGYSSLMDAIFKRRGGAK